MSVTAEIVEITDTTDVWADRIRTSATKTVEAIIATGQTIIACKEALPHGRFEEAVRLAGMSPAAARKLMTVARNPVLSNRSHANVLPVSSETLSILARMEPTALEAAITGGFVGPGTGRTEAKVLAGRDKTARQSTDALATTTAAPGGWIPEVPPLLLKDSGEWSNVPAGARWYCPDCSRYFLDEPLDPTVAEVQCPDCSMVPEDIAERVVEEFDNWVMNITDEVDRPLPIHAMRMIPTDKRGQMIHDLERAEGVIAQLIDSLKGTHEP